MTAEVAILNREAVAIAADSAATVSDQTGQKIFSSANKIFSLSKHHPVGIMIYGNAHFMGVPWEIIIKIFRKKLGTKSFETLKEYGDEFIGFLKEELAMFPQSEQEKYANGCIYGYFIELRRQILEDVEDIIEQKGEISEKEIENITEQIVLSDKKRWEDGEATVDNRTKVRQSLSKKYSDVVKNAKSDIFEKIPFSRKATNALKFIATELFISFPNGISNSGVSGVVITGFGEEEIFPSVLSFSIEGMANDFLKYRQDSYKSIDYENSAMVIPFAQMEMVQTFIDGISPLFGGLYRGLLYETIGNYPRIILEAILDDDFPEKERNKLEKS